jgi:hypothetical protein
VVGGRGHPGEGPPRVGEALPAPDPEAALRGDSGERRGWVATCPWHPGFPPSAIRSQRLVSTLVVEFRAHSAVRAAV